MSFRFLILFSIGLFISQSFVNAQNLVFIDSLSVKSEMLPEISSVSKVKGNGIHYLFKDLETNSKKVILFTYDIKSNLQTFKILRNYFLFSKSNGWPPDDAVIIKNELILLQDNEIRIFKIKNKKLVRLKRYVIKPISGFLGDFSKIYPRNNHEIYLVNTYNFYRPDKLYDNYRIAVFNIKTGKIETVKSYDLGKGIITNFGMGQKFDSRGDKIVLAHPTKLQFYLFNETLDITDTVFLPKYSSINTDSAFNSCFTDTYLEATRNHPSNWLETMNENGLYLYPHIEKIGWLDDTNILISALNVDSIVPTKYSYAGNRILFLYNVENKNFNRLDYNTQKKYLPLSISLDFYTDNNGFMASLWDFYNEKEELYRTLYLSRWNKATGDIFSNNPPSFPDSAYNLKGVRQKIDYSNIKNILYLDVMSCINCFSSKKLKKTCVFVVDNENLPSSTRRGIYSKIHKELKPQGIFFINSKEAEGVPLNTIIPID